jgi:hypothetical protein
VCPACLPCERGATEPCQRSWLAESRQPLRVLLANDAEDEEDELMLLIRSSRLMMRSFNLQDWSQDGSV